MPRLNWTAAIAAAASALALVISSGPTLRGADARTHIATTGVVILASDVRDSMAAVWRRGNEHWNDLAGESTLTQMLGTGRPTQREFMGCLRGRAAGDTVWVDGTVPAARMIRFQFAVTGNCDSVPDLVGTWHTHPYRADPSGRALKERVLSATDLATFARSADRAVLAVWDADSIDAAVRAVNGAVQHPAITAVRGRDLP